MRVLTYLDLEIKGVSKQFAKVREALERDDFRSADVKKLESSHYYRAKLDDTNRLLLQFVRHNAQTVCLALEVIHRHRYDKSRFLRGATVDENKIVDTTPQTAEEVAPNVRYLHPERSHFHFLDKVISFDDTQEAVYQTSPPLILVGSAGSGKTALTLEKLRRQPGPVLYVTHSAYLAQHARGLYFSHGFENPEQEPLFLSFKELLETLRVPSGTEVTFNAFRGWFERHRQAYRHTDAHQVFEEFRGVLSSPAEGVLSQVQYLELGVRQSIFALSEREAIYSLFEKYLTWLKENQLFDVNIVSRQWQSLAEPTYDFIVIDEAQDFTNVQLALILRTLRQPGQFLLCGDANQIVHPNFFSWSGVKSLFWRDPTLAERQTLSVLRVNFRNAKEVTKVANTLLKIKHRRFGSVDRESNFLVEPVADEVGTVEYLPDKDTVKRDLNQKTKGSTQVAVLVLRDEDKTAAKAVFQTPLLFSVHEAKGLEYPTILLYNFISGQRKTFAEICEGVRSEDLQEDTLEYSRAKDKSDKSLEVYKFYINALYVALTRATECVVMIESDQGHPLLQLLAIQQGSEQLQVAAQNSSRQDWEREAAKLELQGKQEQAEAIRKNILRTQTTPWQPWNEETLPELERKAFDKNPSSKAQRSLFDDALWHQQRKPLVKLHEAGFAAAKPFFQRLSFEDLMRYDDVPSFNDGMNIRAVKNARKPIVDRYLSEYQKTKNILWECDMYGVEFRNQVNATPLMLACMAGNVPLAEALLARGANPETSDHYGHNAAMYALNRALQDATYAKTSFATIYELVAPAFVDVQVDERLVRLYPHMGEFYIFLAMLAGLKTLGSSVSDEKSFHKRRKGFFVDHLQRNMEFFPENVVREERRKRSYFNHVLARAELSSTYTPARKLWRRVATGYYLPNPNLKLRVRENHEEVWKPLGEVLNVSRLGLENWGHATTDVDEELKAKG